LSSINQFSLSTRKAELVLLLPYHLSGLALGKAIGRHEVSAVEVLEAIIARVEAVNPQVNAVVTLVAEHAEEEAIYDSPDICGF
jgi:hypothetical protein